MHVLEFFGGILTRQDREGQWGTCAPIALGPYRPRHGMTKRESLCRCVPGSPAYGAYNSFGHGEFGEVPILRMAAVPPTTHRATPGIDRSRHQDAACSNPPPSAGAGKSRTGRIRILREKNTHKIPWSETITRGFHPVFSIVENRRKVLGRERLE